MSLIKYLGSVSTGLVLVGVTVTVMKYPGQSSWGEKVYLVSTSILLFITEVSQDRNPEAGADAEAMEGAAYWLAPHGCSACFPIEPRTTDPGGDHNGLGPPPSITS